MILCSGPALVTNNATLSITDLRNSLALYVHERGCTLSLTSTRLGSRIFSRYLFCPDFYIVTLATSAV